MADLSLEKIKKWSLSTKIISGLALLIIIWSLWAIFGGPNVATKEFKQLPETTIQIENSNGDTISLEIKKGDRDVTLTDVNNELLKNNNLLKSTEYSASAEIKIEETGIARDIAIFGGKGNILQTANLKVGGEETFQPENEYQYILITPEGVLDDNNISVKNESKLITDSIN